MDVLFSCCQGKPGTEGCSISPAHVHEFNKFHDLSGYMKTFAIGTKDYCGVYALDCEMASHCRILCSSALAASMYRIVLIGRFTPHLVLNWRE